MAAVSTDPVCSIEQVSTKNQQDSVVLTDRDVRDILESNFGRKDFRIVDWTLKPIIGAQGFLGQYHHLRVTVQLDNTLKSVRFFAKTLPPTDSPQYDFLQRYDTFNKEIIIYTDVMRRMGRGSGPKWMVDCYLGKRNTIIVLEDASLDGYVSPDKYVPFDEEHCACTLRALSRFHSRSLILNEELRRVGRSILDLYGHLLNEVLFAEDERSQNALSSGIKGALALVDLVEGLKGNERALIKARIEQWGPKLTRLLEPSKRHRNVICHRDIWTNNILIKRDSAGKPISCYIIDFQFTRYCPPAMDFTLLLYLTSDQATREGHYESLMRIYHDSLKEALRDEGLDIEDCLSWADFQDSCVEARRISIMYALTNLQVMLITTEAMDQVLKGSTEEMEDVLYGDKRAKLVSHQFQNTPHFRSRISEVIHEFKKYVTDDPPV